MKVSTNTYRKLGTLRPGLEPNQWVATGSTSSVEGRTVSWTSRLAIAAGREPRLLVEQRHVTLASTLDETVSWYETAADEFDLVDPEIGQMAVACTDAGIGFDYLHVVSDNLTGEYASGLYEERAHGVREARLERLRLIESLLIQSFD